MPLKLYRRKGSPIWNYRGTVAGDRLRGTTKTANKELAARVVSEIENRHFKRHLDGPQEVLTFPQAVTLYQKAGKGLTPREKLYIGRLEDHWKNTKVKDMTPGAIRQSAIDIHPNDGGSTRNRQVITPTRAIINHCAEMELCAPIRVKGFGFEKKIKPPITLDWINTFCVHARPVIQALALDMFATGRRISESRRSDWPDYDFQKRTILVRDQKTKKQRLAHMPNRLLVAMANLPRDKKPFWRSESTLRRWWDEAVEAAAKANEGFSRMTFHSCRHGFATSLLQDGVDVVTVAKLGGWSSPAQVLATYAHAIQDATLTDRLFDTESTRDDNAIEQNQQVRKK